MKAKTVIILSTQSGDWEALYIDGICVEQYRELFEGDRNEYAKYLIENNIDPDEIASFETEDEDEEEVAKRGDLPEKFIDLKGDYTAKVLEQIS